MRDEPWTRVKQVNVALVDLKAQSELLRRKMSLLKGSWI